MYTMIVYTMPNLKLFEYHVIIYKPTFMLILEVFIFHFVVILLNLSACHVIVSVLWLFLTVLWVGLQRLIVIFHCHTDHTRSREEVKRSGMDAIKYIPDP